MPAKRVTIELDDVAFQLQEEHRFDWLQRLGRVFAVFDQQDSGNVSFGVDRDGEKLFVKYAGARPLTFSGEPEDAVDRLKAAVHLYDELRHPSLIELVGHVEVESSYAAMFKWFEGETLHPHWSFPPPAKYSHPESPYYRFRQLSVEQRLASLDAIFSFHEYAENKGFVAVDFYDGSLLHNFTTNETKICDIDLYERKPFVNTMGRLWGSSRFMSPEEFSLGAGIDERTNVFTMGATAFALVGGELDRSFAKWEAGEALYDVASRAVQADRNARYSTVAEFKAAWDLAVQKKLLQL
ncbi:serine/threonine protein kinase [Gordoniibacillus kamchatkensis]|uniref:Serine/threonine protein kinase n=1 Tax=Gordoniibacillus kamchatkensis TaxID=1590651 RepID=A0ABR5AD75_9BACL|nr:serine/threonine protein kinase [Paenibacillus sp. VKM B-2647]KIL38999.1 serine/threonine protein kinase [Paenibacillus sp. VKM B-2647]